VSKKHSSGSPRTKNIHTELSKLGIKMKYMEHEYQLPLLLQLSRTGLSRFGTNSENEESSYIWHDFLVGTDFHPGSKWNSNPRLKRVSSVHRYAYVQTEGTCNTVPIPNSRFGEAISYTLNSRMEESLSLQGRSPVNKETLRKPDVSPLGLHVAWCLCCLSYPGFNITYFLTLSLCLTN
jgi:hypothetical protein